MMRTKKRCIALLFFSVSTATISLCVCRSGLVWNTVNDVYHMTPTERSLKEQQLDYVLPPREVSELDHTAIVPNTVFYVWCGNRTFEYKHYLSVRSVWKYIEPDSLEIHYKYQPIQDKYNTWLDLLKSSIGNLDLKKLPDWVECDSCDTFVGEVIRDRGGVYVSDDTVVLHSLQNFKNKKLNVFLGDKDSPKIILGSMSNSGLDIPNCYSKSDMFKQFATGDDGKPKRCLEYSVIPPNTKLVSDCVFLSHSILPKDIFTANDPMSASLRDIAYGDRKPIVSVRRDTRIPKIVHYIWYGPVNMTFIMYLSIFSSLHVIKADKIFVHGGHYLQGHYWEKVKTNQRVHSVYRETTSRIFGNKVLFAQHYSDVIRADILYKYGGIYLDWDVLWLKPIDDLISAGYDVIVNLDHLPHDPFPESINMGVVFAKPRAKYIDLWRNSYRSYRADDFFYNPLEVPYKIYEMYPSLVRIETRLQVMCFRLLCHPIFRPDYQNYLESQPFDWRTDVYAIHFTSPEPAEYENETVLKKGQGMFAAMGKYILDAANN